jgi:uncharacterized protein (DUF1015 family)
MAKIHPFKALRPARDKAHLVATRPVNTYEAHVLKAKLETNPYSFIHIINPDFYEKTKTEANSDSRFQSVKDKYVQFIDEDILFQDKENAIYLYKQTIGKTSYLGVVAGASVQEYNENKIKKHEATITTRQEMFTNYLEIVGYNAEPVLIAYPKNDEISHLLIKHTSSRPEYEFSTTDKIKHELWVLDKMASQEFIKAFETIPALYIADGHHRSASSAGLLQRKKNKNNPTGENASYFLSYFIEDEQLNILEFNRVIKGYNGLTEIQILKKLEKHFDITSLKKQEIPKAEHLMTMFLSGKWYLLNCKMDIIKNDHPVKCLDAEILTNFIIDPIFGIKDLKTSDRIEFIPGNLGIDGVLKSMKKQANETAAFFLFPATMKQVIRVADAGMKMPPKSTYVEPKMRSGLTIYNINE